MEIISAQDMEKNPVNKPDAQWIDLDDQSVRKISESARMLVVIFIQALKAFRLYEPDHPILSKFLTRLVTAFGRYFKEFDLFSVQIKESQILHRNKIVYESVDTKESLAFLFFRDGIREIRFYKGLDTHETVAFLNIVRKSDIINRLRDDLVTLMWQGNFSHIDITTVEDFLESGGSPAPPADKKTEGAGAGFQMEAAKQAEPDGSRSLALEDFTQELPSSDQSLIDACQLNVHEMDRINRETDQEENPDLIAIVDDLIEILLHLSDEMDAYENIIAYFEQVFHLFLEWKESEKVVEILKVLTDLVENMALQDRQIFAIRRILEIPSNSNHLNLLGYLMKGDPEEGAAILQILQLLTKQATHPLFLLYLELKPGKWKTSVKDRLVQLASEGIEPLAKLIPESKPSVLLRILAILTEARHPSTLKYLNPLVHHDHREVREATLKLLRKFDEKSRPLVEKFLLDPEPEVRGKAAFVLAQTAKEQAIRPLAEIIFSHDFHKREFREKASFIRALAVTESPEALSLLKKISKKGRWFRRERWREMQRVAQMTLKGMEIQSHP